MSLLKSRLTYDMNNLILYENDDYLKNFNIKEEFDRSHMVPIVLLLNFGLKIIEGKTFQYYYNIVHSNCEWLFQYFYTDEEIKIISYYIICSSLNREIWEQNIEEYKQYLDVSIEQLTDKKEIIYCLYIIKRNLLNYYIGFELDDSIINKLFNELLPLSSIYEHFNDTYTSYIRDDVS